MFSSPSRKKIDAIMWPRTYPGEAEAVDPVGKHVPEERGVGVEGGEVGVHVRALPVSYLHVEYLIFIIQLENSQLKTRKSTVE